MLQNLPRFILKPLSRLVRSWPWLRRKVNAYAINGIVNVSRHRPHPWSTIHDYVSWDSLTDRQWSARHLPAVGERHKPEVAELTRMFVRRPEGQVFCAKSTCLFPAFAQYLTDGFIRTRMPNTSAGEQEDPTRRQNTSNHQIDLCTLYGRTQQQTKQLRVLSEQPGSKGRLKSQMISGEVYSPFLFESDGSRIKDEFNCLDVPLGIDRVASPEQRAKLFAAGGDRINSVPQVAAINTLLLREHNRLAGEIEAANPGWCDEQVFQTTRNCLIVMFIKIVVEEYINHISPAPFPFTADPSVAWDAPWNKPNWIAIEFSLLYRWHSLIPDTIEWAGTSYPVGQTLMNNQPLLDAGLLRAFADLSSQKAARLGAFNTNETLLGFELSAIKQDRLCRLDSYNKYREYVSLPAVKSFSEISTNPEVVQFLSSKYGSPDEIDFYVGLFAEDPIPNSPLPPLLFRMVAVDAFSQALTNPLLSRHVFKASTFSEVGWKAINETSTLRTILARNIPQQIGDISITMTQPDWTAA